MRKKIEEKKTIIASVTSDDIWRARSIGLSDPTPYRPPTPDFAASSLGGPVVVAGFLAFL
jgi:hypothetical protein